MRPIVVRLALQDILSSLKQFGLAVFLAWEDIRQRYVRTALGPLWIVLSTALWFGVMGFVMANLFKQDLHEYLPFLVSGLLSWLLISTCINESSHVLVTSSPLITSFRIPIFTHYIRFVLRNVIIFFHNVIILLIVLCIFPPPVNGNTLLVIPGLFIVLLIMISLAVFLSLANLRYRDTHLAVSSAMQVLPFVTPIYWDKAMLQKHKWIADLNPLYHMIQIIRAPILGQAPEPMSWVITIGGAAIMLLLATLLFVRYRHRIIFWL
jgi:ABC-type polysaccharide/polyol phosphate export permease